jgi:NADP-dependent 3-hydroxy acid dehydrogenase YdfG
MNMARIANHKITQTLPELCGLDVIVNNAGAPRSKIEEATAERIEELYYIWDYAPNFAS